MSAKDFFGRVLDGLNLDYDIVVNNVQTMAEPRSLKISIDYYATMRKVLRCNTKQLHRPPSLFSPQIIVVVVAEIEGAVLRINEAALLI